jgi:hypothetical protein
MSLEWQSRVTSCLSSSQRHLCVGMGAGRLLHPCTRQAQTTENRASRPKPARRSLQRTQQGTCPVTYPAHTYCYHRISIANNANGM